MIKISDEKKVLLVIGHGFTAAALSRRLVGEGWRVIGTTRDPEKVCELASLGVEPRIWPGDNINDSITDATHLLLSVAPDAAGDPVLGALGDRIMQNTKLDWVGYLSTTAVYGDHNGGWVNEDTPVTPTTDRGRLRVDAERAWQNLFQNGRAAFHIFRLGGIYGPGRGPFAKVKHGTARRIIKKGQVFSRIHVEDIASVLRASIENPDGGAIYNVCDDEAAPPQDVIALAAELLGIEVPPKVSIENANMSDMARSFYAESKRVKNDRIKRDLGVKLLYPTYREGLGALLSSETKPETQAL